MALGKLGARGGFGSLGSNGKAAASGGSPPSTAGQPMGLLLALTKAS